MNRSDDINLGVGLGIGLATLVVAIIGVAIQWRKWKRRRAAQ
jgi:hypothetical protein